ncbi:reprolysin-like metallopeptidase [Flagellimonas sp. S3867]|uniref:reprolysin-like metallopeptidase n=1 Tax=Flagellimonas sp. S3867 TaxID=2768063 RepID=UPI001682D3E8|nr:zinc-dependent metalloprotease family protein [Flagellimonas sp. S3867]
MKAKLHLVFSITIFFACFCTYAQQGYWQSIPKKSNFKSISVKDMDKGGAVFSLDDSLFSKELKASNIAKGGMHTIYLPSGNGKVIAFQLTETSVLHPELAKKYPNIKSFTGQSLDGKYRVKLSSSHKGLQSMIVDLEGSETTFMEPLLNKKGTYVIYNKKEQTKIGFECGTEKLQQTLEKKLNQSTGKTIVPLVGDQLLRKYRIAVSTTGEYAQFHGGTVADALAAINATLTRINEVFETDLGVTMELVANNDQVIFTNAATDPYNGNLNAQVQSTLTSTIGEANYDVGHLFNKVASVAQNNGNAGFIGAVCVDNRKGSAFSAAFEPQGDVFDLDFVSHELGHQFGANHTWSFESEGTGVQAEPASGTTIMGYAGIVPGNNVAPNGDDYFHYHSIVQISNYLQTVSCAQTTALTNIPPVVTPMGDYTIPKGTAFMLEGSATDSDLGDVLTYAWEQIDDGVVTTNNFGPDNPSGANFRSLPPTTDPTRYFPRLSRVVQGNLTQTMPQTNDAWETVSNIERNMKFALTVRDNAAGGGQVVSDILDVQVLKSAGPFSVTSQATNVVYEGGSTQEVTWDVANTNLLPIDAKNVDILLSLDGGNTFPITLADDTLNDGSEEILIPGDATTTARIMIKASDNVFFSVNAADFTIQESPIVLNFQNLSYQVCQPSNSVIPFVYETFGGFSETSTFSVTGLPAGVTESFSPTQASTDDTAVNLTISNTNATTPGTYAVTVTATSTSITKNVPLTLVINDGNFVDVVLTSPIDTEANTAVHPLLQWENNELYSNYDVEIATDVGFSSLVESASGPFNFYQTTSLSEETEYFWRVRPSNNCGTGTFGTPFSFTTNQVDCKNLNPSGLPLEITALGTPTVTSAVQIFEDLQVSDVNVSIELTHTFLEDLIIDLISPSGTRVTLISNACGDANNMNAVFDDAGTALVCGGNPAISGTVAPLGSLSSLNGETTLGEWTLEIRDTFANDGGSLVAFSLEVCAEGAFRPDDDEDGVFDDGDDLCLGTPKGVEVDTNGCPVNRFASDNFTVQIQSESCRNNNDGSVGITASDTSITYTAVLSGGSADLNMDFTDAHTFQNLNAGNYSLCITGTDGSITYQEVCFNVVIEEPALLSTFATVDENVLSLTMEGGSLYNVELNGLVTQTIDSEIQLELKEGLNTLKVFTNLSCQGSFEDTFFISSKPILYRNPVGADTRVFLNGFVGDLDIQVFSANGQMVMKTRRRMEGNELEMDFSGLQTGIYFMRIQGSEIYEEFKLIKE